MKLADKLQKLQNRAARTLTFSNYDTDAAQLFERLWNSLRQNVRQAESLNNLKTLLKKHYRNK